MPIGTQQRVTLSLSRDGFPMMNRCGCPALSQVRISIYVQHIMHALHACFVLYCASRRSFAGYILSHRDSIPMGCRVARSLDISYPIGIQSHRNKISNLEFFERGLYLAHLTGSNLGPYLTPNVTCNGYDPLSDVRRWTELPGGPSFQVCFFG